MTIATMLSLGETALKLGPVSYTHLDVYKRQGVCFYNAWTPQTDSGTEIR